MKTDISETRDIETCRAIRRRVFVEGEGVPESAEMDELDDGARHFLACIDAVPVGTARLVISGDTGRIGHVCVLPGHRGAGLGGALTRAAIDAARQEPGVTRLTLGARRPAVGLYRRFGFVADGAYTETDWGASLPMVLGLS